MILAMLSNGDLLAALSTRLRERHTLEAWLIACLVEVKNRNLHLENAYSSMWDFCVRGHGMSEHEAQLRLRAMRVVREFPSALGYLERGEVHLSGLYALSDHLTSENHEELLREATRKSVRAIEVMLAARFPMPDSQQKARGRIRPLSTDRYRIDFTISAERNARVDRIKDLMRHRNPTGDLEMIFDRATDLLLDELEKEVLGKTSRATTTAMGDASVARTASSGSEVPRAVRREVFERDDAQCSYVDADGNRCPERGFLELDHVRPKAHGGSDTIDNLRILCRAHNRLHAEQTFGREYVAQKINLAQAKQRDAPASAFRTAASALRKLGFHRHSVHRALAKVRTQIAPETASTEKILREALLLLA